MALGRTFLRGESRKLESSRKRIQALIQCAGQGIRVGYNMSRSEGRHMYGAFDGYTRWAVVFLIIFVLFFLLVPAYTQTCTTTPVY